MPVGIPYDGHCNVIEVTLEAGNARSLRSYLNVATVILLAAELRVASTR